MPEIDYFKDLAETVSFALKEDMGTGDVTAAVVPKHTQAHATVMTKEAAVICGRPWFDETFHQLDSELDIHWHVTEGQKVEAGTLLCELKGSARTLLTGERTALNFLQTLSATATTTDGYVQQLSATDITLLDTRKTLPCLRLAQKYAVACGGAQNHRIGLYDAILIKENHIAAAGGIAEAITLARTSSPGLKVEVETETLDELSQAIEAGADIIMLDNFSDEMIKDAMQLKNEHVAYEISGNVELDRLKDLSQYGIDYISSGALTKNIRAIDLSMRLTLQ